MPLFLIIPRTAGVIPTLDQRVREAYDEKSSLKLDLGAWVISAAETAGEVANRLEIPGDAKPLSAIVFGLTGTYTGRAPPAIWDWLKVALERRSDG